MRISNWENLKNNKKLKFFTKQCSRVSMRKKFKFFTKHAKSFVRDGRGTREGQLLAVGISLYRWVLHILKGYNRDKTKVKSFPGEMLRF